MYTPEDTVEAQQAFDAHATPMCPAQLTAPNLHRVLSYAPLQSHIWGGKGVGSQGDGTCQLLCLARVLRFVAWSYRKAPTAKLLLRCSSTQ